MNKENKSATSFHKDQIRVAQVGLHNSLHNAEDMEQMFLLADEYLEQALTNYGVALREIVEGMMMDYEYTNKFWGNITPTEETAHQQRLRIQIHNHALSDVLKVLEVHSKDI